MVTEFPTGAMQNIAAAADIIHPDTDLPPTREDLLGEQVFFVTQVGAWPAIVVEYDNTTKRAILQVFNRKTDGCNLVGNVRHISTDDAPCWAWKHETPFAGLQSLNRGQEAPKRAHTRRRPGGLSV